MATMIHARWNVNMSISMATNDLLLHVAESAMAHLEFSTSGYIERNQLWRLGVPKARKPRSNFLDNVSFSTGCRYITTSCLASAILNFWLSVILTISAMAPLSSRAPQTWIEPSISRFYLIWEQRYKYFRFGGRHIEFLNPVSSGNISNYVTEFMSFENLSRVAEILFLSRLVAGI